MHKNESTQTKVEMQNKSTNMDRESLPFANDENPFDTSENEEGDYVTKKIEYLMKTYNLKPTNVALIVEAEKRLAKNSKISNSTRTCYSCNTRAKHRNEIMYFSTYLELILYVLCVANFEENCILEYNKEIFKQNAETFMNYYSNTICPNLVPKTKSSSRKIGIINEKVGAVVCKLCLLHYLNEPNAFTNLKELFEEISREKKEAEKEESETNEAGKDEEVLVQLEKISMPKMRDLENIFLYLKTEFRNIIQGVCSINSHYTEENKLKPNYLAELKIENFKATEKIQEQKEKLFSLLYKEKVNLTNIMKIKPKSVKAENSEIFQKLKESVEPGLKNTFIIEEHLKDLLKSTSKYQEILISC